MGIMGSGASSSPSVSPFDAYIGHTMVSCPTGWTSCAIETFTLEKTDDGHYATIGTASGRNEYYLKNGDTLQHKLWWITCTIEQGEFQWSHGYTSRLQNDSTPMKASEKRRHKEARSTETEKEPRPIKLVLRHVPLSMDTAWHWGLGIGDSIYEVGGSMAVIGPNGVVHSTGPILTTAWWGTRLEQFDAYLPLTNVCEHTDAEIEDFVKSWVRRNPVYHVTTCNCQTFTEDLYVHITGERLPFSQWADFTDLQNGPEASADVVWLSDRRPRYGRRSSSAAQHAGG